ncbi:MFS transporter [Sutcliffiella rhizosphaerae]|uniref:Major facilitator superfamily (MFS) profile domain-containing protein n=1 Tax=Sutcliffiella rhizosphaerae TaxID=2880967 RepID=A0ABM8YPE0_9BACI|nr:MFS transporter [Sutcliffiella rhizosphaerae]CAG9621868.1 hypothetical protein BACCIP111883_02659 [Sutcliffiella rhizosphaerae]
MSNKNRVIGIAIITAIAVLGDAMLFIVLPIYWREFGLTALWQIGLLLSINRFIRLPINPLVGLFYRHFQLRTGVVIAVVIAVITTFSYGIFQDFWVLLLMRALWGIAWSLLRLGGFLTVIEVSNDESRGHHVGLYNGLWGIGGLVGMLAGGFLVDQTSVYFVSTLFSVLGVIIFPFIFYLVPLIKASDTKKKSTGTNKKWLTSYVGMVLTTGIVLGMIVFGLFASTVSALIERVYINDWSLFGMVLGAASIAGALQAIRWGWDPFIAPRIGRMLDKSDVAAKFLFIPLFGGGLLFLILGNTQSIYLLIFFLLLYQISSTFFVTITDTLATSVASKTDAVKVITAHTVVVDVGAAIGPVLSFLILHYFGLTAVYMVAGVLLLILGVGWTIFLKRNNEDLSQ